MCAIIPLHFLTLFCLILCLFILGNYDYGILFVTHFLSRIQILRHWYVERVLLKTAPTRYLDVFMVNYASNILKTFYFFIHFTYKITHFLVLSSFKIFNWLHSFFCHLLVFIYVTACAYLGVCFLLHDFLLFFWSVSYPIYCWHFIFYWIAWCISFDIRVASAYTYIP
jgi:hypothetical protein